jgi:multisubunit Na+/H+ antiporter MnhC subunit
MSTASSLVMCLFILLNMSMVPAIVALSILGFGLLLILLTLLTYFFTWSTKNGELTGLDSSIYHTVDATHLCDADIDVAQADELSTLV